MQSIGLESDVPIQSTIVNQSLDSAQKKVEAYYFDGRKQLFEYDEALTMQRNGIYFERKRILEKLSLRDWAIEYGQRSLYDISLAVRSREYTEIDNFLAFKMQELLGLPYEIEFSINERDAKMLDQFWRQQFQISYAVKESQLDALEPGLIRELERSFLLQTIDFCWKEHLQKIAALRGAIRWRAYAQRDPLTDYKKESYSVFITMLSRIRHQVIYYILRSKITIQF